MRVVIDTNTLLSGLFFRGHERSLLLSALRGRIRLLLPEDGSDELFRVTEDTFGDSPVFDEGLRLLWRLLRVVELVPRDTYGARVRRWAGKMRDPSDAFLFAAAQALGADGIVSGDRDVLEARDTEGIRLFRTRDLLKLVDPAEPRREGD